MYIQQPPQRQPYLQPRFPTQVNPMQIQRYQPLIAQTGTQKQQPYQFKQNELLAGIPVAKSIQYEESKDKKKHSSEMVQLIKESQELKKDIQQKEQEITKCKTNIERLEQLIDYLEKQQEQQE